MSARYPILIAGRSVDFPDLFGGISSDVLFRLEEQRGEMDDASDYIEQLLVTLAEWRVCLLDGSRTDAGEYRRCLDKVREAWLQYSFRWVGGPSLPYPFDLPAGTPQ
ncbi:hypothetical protein GCM10011583_53120 [Streptomyces camponoticapitis]|uniref:Uncharacterized protein n=1 Tax=Streptomyces camponoticapitis TaxID=1616125 RepID=A0ABQ2EKB5_9ACTN|nr:hypothetical protein [Streptomyces camponoticapitis]GGK14527.1 hypothetical protein GCM10011583_53120 [Streptomyces camponoticapitis]